MSQNEFPPSAGHVWTQPVDRRELFRQVAAVAAVTSVGSLARVDAQQNAAGTLIPGFAVSKIQTSGATIHVAKGGEGPPLLLLHGAPQTHSTWRLIAPELARRYTVIAPDLRGYGDSSKPPGGDGHVNYSKRAMALDHVEVMRHFGFSRFPVVGHDRGGRVAHRMALDHPDAVTKLAVVDIIPTYYHYTHVTLEFVQSYYHWFSYLRRAPVPENELQAQWDAAAERASTDIQREYARAMRNPDTIHAMCEDYRAAASIDLRHDAADLHRRIACPLLVLWGERGTVGRLFDPLPIWQERGTDVRGTGMPGGHNLQEELPDQVLAEVSKFLEG